MRDNVSVGSSSAIEENMWLKASEALDDADEKYVAALRNSEIVILS